MPILALDFGEKNIGIAISDPEEKIAFGRGTIPNKGKKFVLKQLLNICRRDKIKKIVIGLPKLLSGQESKQAAQVRSFAKYVKISLKLPVFLEDERLTSKQAHKTGACDVHQESARIILESFLAKDY